MTPQTLIDELPALFRPEVAGRMKATVQITLTGEGGGHWWVTIAAGTCTTGTGPAANPDTTLTATAADYVRIRSGQLDPIAATRTGQLTIAGKPGIAVKFAKLFGKSTQD